MKIIFLTLALLFLVNYSYSCTAACNGCTCAPTYSCGPNQMCYGQGPDCYCGTAKHQDHIILKKLESLICELIQELKEVQFILPISENNQTIAVNCMNGQPNAYLLVDKN